MKENRNFGLSFKLFVDFYFQSPHPKSFRTFSNPSDMSPVIFTPIDVLATHVRHTDYVMDALNVIDCNLCNLEAAVTSDDPEDRGMLMYAFRRVVEIHVSLNEAMQKDRRYSHVDRALILGHLFDVVSRVPEESYAQLIKQDASIRGAFIAAMEKCSESHATYPDCTMEYPIYAERIAKLVGDSA